MDKKTDAQDAMNNPAQNAVNIEIETTKDEKQKAEIAEELFPPVKRIRSMRTRRVLH